MPCRICCEWRDSQFIGDLLQSVVAHTDDFPDSVGDGKHIGSTFSIFKQKSFRIAIVWVAPTVEDVQHFRGDDRADDLGAAIGVSCLGTKEADLTIDYILIFKEKHIAEIDTIAEVREEPKVAVALAGSGAFIGNNFTNMIVRESETSGTAFRDDVLAAAERKH